ncbi:MAG: ASKHA domain-containing protein [Firmicutes bacterium]|nr:ASKHA domain-containing protein [Bacillota bacterium]
MVITVLPDGRRVEVAPETPLLDALNEANQPAEAVCAGAGTCGKCRVRVHGPCSAATEAELSVVGGTELAEGVRLACQVRALGDCSVEVLTPLVRGHPRILTDADLPPFALEPRGIEQMALRPGDSQRGIYGLAIDLGTTTVAAWLLDLLTGEEMARASALNPQVVHGGDVISRLTHAVEQGGLEELHREAVRVFNLLTAELAKQAGIHPHQIYHLVVAANATMQHFLLRVDPTGLSRAPFRPAFLEAPATRARDLGLVIRPDAVVELVPGIGGFVGGDTVAAILATGQDRTGQATCLLDLGTNGEIVAGYHGRLVACSTAAGPAFEGAKISQGMRGDQGAIEGVALDREVRLRVIGDAPPAGICGSGLIDAGAELARVGILDETGRIRSPDECTPFLPPRVLERLVPGEAGTYSFALALGSETRSGKPVLLTQKDVRELQSAKGAIVAGARLALAHLGLEESQVDEVILAGAFGTYVRPVAALAVGLIPMVAVERVRSAGNAAGAGARMVLLSRTQATRAREIARRAEHLDLASHPDFVEQFMRGMYFPRVAAAH